MEEVLDFQETKTELKYAGFWVRVLASFIDGIIVSVAQAVVMFAFGAIGDPFSPAALILPWVFLIAQYLYYALMESSEAGATLGKQALGIKVVEFRGKKVTFGQATGRYFGKILSALIIFIGFLMVAFNKEKQGLHDMMAGTYVVDKNSVNENI